jgi:hypothetical protein
MCKCVFFVRKMVVSLCFTEFDQHFQLQNPGETIMVTSSIICTRMFSFMKGFAKCHLSTWLFRLTIL